MHAWDSGEIGANLNEQIERAVYRAIDDLNLQLPEDRKLEKSPDAVLFGKNGQLDSLGLVSFIVEVERKVEEELGVSIILADERALSQQNSPFMSLQSLEKYVALLIKEDGSSHNK